MAHKVTFNTGFITAIALFLEHKDNWQKMKIDKSDENGIMKKVLLSDLRLYGATDHLYDMEIPKFRKVNMPKSMFKTLQRIIRWRAKCFHYRLEHFKDTKITDELFKEAEQILKAIDEKVFQTKEVIMRYR